MELSFDVAQFLGASAGQHGPFVGRVDQAWLDAHQGDQRITELMKIIRSRPWQRTEGLDPLMGSDAIYVLAEAFDLLGVAQVGVRCLKALPPSIKADDLKGAAGVKGGYGAYQSSLQEIHPKCLLEFHVAETFRRRRLGRALLDAVLAAEGISPVEFAYATPSESMLAFLRRHFQLDPNDCTVISSFLLFDDYFRDRSSGPKAEKPHSASKPQVSSCQNECDEPVVEEVPEMAELNVQAKDPLAAYKAEEQVFYTQRAKLYCFNDNEWQDAGAGNVNFLRNTKSGRVRLVWYQEGTQRIVANHFIVNTPPFCDLQRHSKGNDKAWMWTAKERLLERRFALKFKSSEDSGIFKDTFDEAKRHSSEKDPIDYVILCKVGVTESADLPSRHLQLLSVGTTVGVQEVMYAAQDQRVRARIVAPAGWITLMSHNPVDAASYAVAKADLERLPKIR
eukprot:TRINITY_DN102385_c0_g1_i1.p1 TRINITY_DN102385_c0_g1~~TRINITY_DN102385_c0_g1_i1.p1  ORF type:complete len:450 (+),score=82.31 TRINITY_DN102385_c0_g1_i1:72-1421(+)